MHPQLSACSFVAPLKQYPKTTLCRRTKRCLQTAPRSSESPHSFSRCRRHEAPSPRERHRRQFHTTHRPLTDHRPSNLHASSAKFGLQQASQSFPINQRRGTHSGPEPEGIQRYAVIGGGISGLTSAFKLAANKPEAKITLYESSDRLGGWVQTKYVNVDNGHIVFEQGPRTLQPHTLSGLFTLDLINTLGIQDKITFTHRSMPQARNRFIYYPDRLVKMPGGDQDIFELLRSLMVEPIYKGSLKALAYDILNDVRDENLADESISSFFNRRFEGPDITNNVISAVIHGIYAGDIDKLSIKSLFPTLWNLEKQYTTVFGGLIVSQYGKEDPQRKRTPRESHERKWRLWLEARLEEGKFANTLKMARAYTFVNGVGTLTSALESSLKSIPDNVEIRMNEKVTGIEYDTKPDRIKISTANNQPPETYTNCISTIPASTLTTLTPHLPDLKGIHSVTVMVVNLFYRSTDLIRQPGFGYLIPRSVPFSQNPECALGVVFDSNVGPGLDSIEGTKISVIIGGHYWDHLSHYPDEEDGARMAKNLLKRHLGINEEPAAVMVGLHKDCIPQYYVGHDHKMKNTDVALRTEFNSRLSVAGSSYNGIGVNDCVRAAMEVAEAITSPEKYPRRATGLEYYRDGNPWAYSNSLK